jgi:hypothetical protein
MEINRIGTRHILSNIFVFFFIPSSILHINCIDKKKYNIFSIVQNIDQADILENFSFSGQTIIMWSKRWEGKFRHNTLMESSGVLGSEGTE